MSPSRSELAWHTLSAEEVLRSEGADGQRGLSSAEAASRARRFGPNKLAAAKAEPRWHAFGRHYRDPMQIVLLAAGIGSLYPLKQLGTGILLILLTLFNAIMGLQQEGKAAASVAALQKMMIITARVRRDGQLAEIPAGQLVPGDIVLIEAGDIVPADGGHAGGLRVRAHRREPAGHAVPPALLDRVQGRTGLGVLPRHLLRQDVRHHDQRVLRPAGPVHRPGHLPDRDEDRPARRPAMADLHRRGHVDRRGRRDSQSHAAADRRDLIQPAVPARPEPATGT